MHRSSWQGVDPTWTAGNAAALCRQLLAVQQSWLPRRTMGRAWCNQRARITRRTRPQDAPAQPRMHPSGCPRAVQCQGVTRRPGTGAAHRKPPLLGAVHAELHHAQCAPAQHQRRLQNTPVTSSTGAGGSGWQLQVDSLRDFPPPKAGNTALNMA